MMQCMRCKINAMQNSSNLIISTYKSYFANTIMHNMEFGQSYCKDLFKKILWKFILYFYDMYSIFYELLNFNEFLKNFKSKNDFKID
jgi:hypothetical protein